MPTTPLEGPSRNSRGSPYHPSCLFGIHKRAYHTQLVSVMPRIWRLLASLAPHFAAFIALADMVYLWLLMWQCIERPQWKDIGEMGLPWMNVCREHIMLTWPCVLDPWGCDVREPWLAGKDLLPTSLLGPLLCCLHHLGGMDTDAAM